MHFVSTLAHYPRRLLLRRAVFQVHLWLGVLLSLYVALIGISGSVLVFEDELRAQSTHDLHFNPNRLADPSHILANAARAYPGEPATYLLWPSTTTPAYTLYLHTAHGANRTILADAGDGHLLAARSHLFIDTVHDFHVYLLLGQTGFTLNCLAGIGLVFLALTGAVLWWPGLRLWLRGFRINFRSSWKRISYDTHSAVGILTLAIVSWWGLTCIAFLWPKQTAAAVNFVSALQGMREPELPKRTLPRQWQPDGAERSASIPSAPLEAGISLPRVLAEVHTLNPRGSLSGLSLPASRSGNIVAYVDTREVGDFSHRDIHTFSADNGCLFTTWHYGQNRTAGDWVLWLVSPLHFGTLWGMPVKIAWCLLGLSLPVLSITGLLMYWNRLLGKRWK